MEEDSDSISPLVGLDNIRTALRPIAGALGGSEKSPDAPALLTIARDIQRLIASVITDIARQADHDVATAPLDTLLADSGTVPRSQVQTEIERVRVDKAFSAVADQRRQGQAHTGNIDVLARLTRAMSDDEVAALAEHDEALADAAGRLSEESFRKRVTRLRNTIRSDGGATAAQQVIEDSFARISPTTERDAYRLHALLDPIRGAAVKAALAREAKHLADHPELCTGLTPAQIAAQALHDLVLRGDGLDRMSTPRASVQISVLADRDTLERGPHGHSIAETFDGLPIGTGTLGRLCCDASMRMVTTAPDASVEVSRTARAPSAAQRAALRALYPLCPLSGVGWESIEIHHVIFFETSQRTVLSELVPISRRWHHLIHDDGWILTMDADRTLHLSQPDGTPFRTIAPPTPINQHDHDLAA